METGAQGELAEVGIGGERFRASLLDERQRLGAGEERQALFRDVRAGHGVREASNALDPHVDPGGAGAGEHLDQLVADEAARRDQDLLVERQFATHVREGLDETGQSRVVGSERKSRLRGHGNAHSGRSIPV